MKKQLGFNLIELLVAVAIVGILAGIAFPAYQDSVRKARRADAKESLLTAAAIQEKLFLQSHQYSETEADIGGTTSSEGYYTIAADFVGANTSTFLLTATATGAQASDTDCAKFTVNHIGQQKAYKSGGSENADCW